MSRLHSWTKASIATVRKNRLISISIITLAVGTLSCLVAANAPQHSDALSQTTSSHAAKKVLTATEAVNSNTAKLADDNAVQVTPSVAASPNKKAVATSKNHAATTVVSQASPAAQSTASAPSVKSTSGSTSAPTPAPTPGQTNAPQPTCPECGNPDKVVSHTGTLMIYGTPITIPAGGVSTTSLTAYSSTGEAITTPYIAYQADTPMITSVQRPSDAQQQTYAVIQSFVFVASLNVAPGTYDLQVLANSSNGGSFSGYVTVTVIAQ